MAPLVEKALLLALGGIATGVAMFAKPIAAWWAAYWQKRAQALTDPVPLPPEPLAPAVVVLTPPLPPPSAPEPAPPLSQAQFIRRRQSEDFWDEVEAQVQIVYEEFLADRVTLMRYRWQGVAENRQLIAECLYEAKIPRLRSVKRDYRGGVEVTGPVLSLVRRLQAEGNLYLPDVAKLPDAQLRALLSYYGIKEAYYHLLLLGSITEPIGCLSVSYATFHGLSDEQLAGLHQSARVIQHLLVMALHAEEVLALA